MIDILKQIWIPIVIIVIIGSVLLWDWINDKLR